jgi:hypothetical protein
MAALGFDDLGGRVAEWHAKERAFQVQATGVDIPREFSAVQAFRCAVRRDQI